MNEIWKDIEGYEGIYQVSNFGNVKVLRREIWNGKGIRIQEEKILKQSTNMWGYCIVTLTKNSVRLPHKVHRLVAKAFIPNYENKEQVNHIDGDKTNNHVENLEWNTRQENMSHAYINNLYKDMTSDSNLIVLKDDEGNIISQYSSFKALSDTINLNAGKLLKTLKNNNVNFDCIKTLNNKYPIDLKLNKFVRSSKYFPLAVYDEDMNLLAMYTNGTLLTKFTTIPENVVTKANKNGIFKYKKRGKEYKNYYYIKKISFVDFFTYKCDIIDDELVIK